VRAILREGGLSFEPIAAVDDLLVRRRDPQVPRFILRKPRTPACGVFAVVQHPGKPAGESGSCGRYNRENMGARPQHLDLESHPSLR
jgi:hypothetical protein